MSSARDAHVALAEQMHADHVDLARAGCRRCRRAPPRPSATHPYSALAAAGANRSVAMQAQGAVWGRGVVRTGRGIRFVARCPGGTARRRT